MKTKRIEENKQKIKELELKVESWKDTSIEGLQKRNVLQADISLMKMVVRQDLMRISRYTLLKKKV